MNEEQVWLEKARRGDKNAFGQLIEAYQGPVYNLAYRMLGNSGEAEEAAQEAFNPVPSGGPSGSRAC